jgi:aliphatic nitrilase
MDSSIMDAVAKGDKAIMDTMERSPRSVSMILGPDGALVSEALSDSEGIVYADIDTELQVEPKQFHDVVGYYNRFDIFTLRIDRSHRDPAVFIDQSQDPTRAAQHDDNDDRDSAHRSRRGPSRQSDN